MAHASSSLLAIVAFAALLSCQARSLQQDNSIGAAAVGTANFYKKCLKRPHYYKWCPKTPSPAPAASPSPAPSACPKSAAVSYVNLLRSNDSFPSINGKETHYWGMMRDRFGQDVNNVLPATAAVAYAAAPPDAGGFTFPPGSGYNRFKQYSNAPDIPTMYKRGQDVYMVNHFEYGQPGSMYISKLSQDATSGALKVTATEAIKDEVGTWFPCSGTTTPWDSHLGSEEYPADCRLYEATLLSPTCTAAPTDFTACGWTTKAAYDAYSALSMGRLLGGPSMHPISPDADVANTSSPVIIDFNKAVGFGTQGKIQEFRNIFNCYNYGWSPEVTIAQNGDYNYKKWKTLGRVSHESAIVMPDLKTVYTTDDGTNCGFYMFKADKSADLSKGTLYAAKLTQDGAVDNFKVTWIKLGSSTQDDIDKMVAKRPKFSDIFETAQPVANTANFCPPGFSATNTPNFNYLWPETPGPNDPSQAHIECLKVKPGMTTAAAFLETRRYAAMLGATTEFEKEEGLTLNPKTNELYVAYTSIANGMTDNPKYSAGQKGDINMPENKCGAIFSYQLDSNYQATSVKAMLYGKPMTPDGDGNKCELDAVANPDNLHYTNGILFIAEDTSSHLNNVLWAYDLELKTLTRILSSPRLAEVTGIYISYIGDYAYLALGMQHPEEDTPAPAITLPIALAQRSYVGYIGPLNAACLKAGKKPVFAGIPVAKTPEEKSAVLSTNLVEYQ